MKWGAALRAVRQKPVMIKIGRITHCKSTQFPVIMSNQSRGPIDSLLPYYMRRAINPTEPFSSLTQPNLFRFTRGSD